MLDVNKLDNLIDKGTYYISACIACRIDNSSDKTGNHLIIYKNTGKYGCAVNNSTEHKKRIFQLAGIQGGQVPQEPVKSNPSIKECQIYDESCLIKLLPKWDLLLERGISKDTLREFKIGFCQAKTLRLRYAAPVYNLKNQLHGFWGRRYKDTPETEKYPKYLYIGRKSKFLWPSHLNRDIIKGKEIYLVESPLCVLKAWTFGYKNLLCLFGVSLSPTVLNYLVSLNPSKIFVSTNNEVDNNSIGNNAAIEIKAKLNKFFSDEKVIIKLPVETKDICDMNEEQLKVFFG